METRFSCPNCGSDRFGTYSPPGVEMDECTGHCGECSFEWRRGRDSEFFHTTYSLDDLREGIKQGILLTLANENPSWRDSHGDAEGWLSGQVDAAYERFEGAVTTCEGTTDA